MSEAIEWRPLPTYPRYSVSSGGIVHDVQEGVDLRTSTAKDGGYQKVFLRDSLGGTVHHSVHNLVARTYLGPPPSSASLVMHLDHNPRNNSVANLQWGTHKTNAAGRLERGTVLRGEQLHNAVLTAKEAEAVRVAYSEGSTTTEVAEAFGISRQNVNAIVNGRSWRHVGGPPAPQERRKRKGEKLSVMHVRQIRADAAAGIRQGVIAQRFGISQPAVSAIVTRKRWPQVE